MNPLSTRVLLICAAIGVASGLPFMLTSGLHVIVTHTIPLLYGPLLGLYYLPAAIALPLLRAPGVGIITALISGLLVMVSPLQPLGPSILGGFLLIGVFQELGYAILLYRRWPLWSGLLLAVVSGLVLATVFHFVFELGDRYALWLVIAQFAATPAAAVLATVLGWVIAQRLLASGAYRPRGGTATTED